jgi:hypothetical protein
MLNLRDLIRDNKPIYVKNCTGKFLEKQADHILEIRHEGKKSQQVIIPATKFPFHLSARVPATALASCSELFDAINRGILELVDPDDAKNIMKDPLAQKAEAHALRRFQPVKRESVVPPELKKFGHTPEGVDKGISEVPPDDVSFPLRVADTEEDDVKPAVVQILKDIKTDPALRDEKYLELVALPDLTEDDYGYVLVNCDVAKIKQWARDEMVKLVGEDRVDELEAEQAEAEATGTQLVRRKKHRRQRR